MEFWLTTAVSLTNLGNFLVRKSIMEEIKSRKYGLINNTNSRKSDSMIRTVEWHLQDSIADASQ